VAKKVAVLASDDNQRARGISYISGLEGGKVVISRQSKSGGPEVLQMLELKAGRVAVSIDGKYVGVATPDKAFEAAVGFMNGKSLVRRAPEKAAV
jgi:hypothetical protein